MGFSIFHRLQLAYLRCFIEFRVQFLGKLKFLKNNRRCQTKRFAGSKKAFSKTAHDAPIKRKSHLTNGGKLWYNTFSNRAKCVLFVRKCTALGAVMIVKK